MISSIGWTESNLLSTLCQLNSIDIYHIIKTQKILMWKLIPMIEERPKGQREIEENSLIQKEIIEKTIEIKEKEQSN